MKFVPANFFSSSSLAVYKVKRESTGRILLGWFYNSEIAAYEGAKEEEEE